MTLLCVGTTSSLLPFFQYRCLSPLASFILPLEKTRGSQICLLYISSSVFLTVRAFFGTLFFTAFIFSQISSVLVLPVSSQRHTFTRASSSIAIPISFRCRCFLAQQPPKTRVKKGQAGQHRACKGNGMGAQCKPFRAGHTHYSTLAGPDGELPLPVKKRYIHARILGMQGRLPPPLLLAQSQRS